MSRIEIYDVKMVDSVKKKGAIVNQKSVRIAELINALEKEKKDIVWYDYLNTPEAYSQNKLVDDMLMKEGTDILPITVVEGKIMKVGEFPSNLEIGNWLGMTKEELMRILLKSVIATSTSDCSGCSDNKNGCSGC
jgi:hypothetical protein